MNEKNSPLANKVLFFLLLLFFIGLIGFKPYEQTQFLNNSTFNTLFNLYFFIINQTLGIVHEAGHGVCYILPCPEFLTALNGTLFQLAFPFFIGCYYLKQGNKILYFTSLFFVGISLKYTAWYISTSRQNGAILSAQDSFLGIDSYHDFYYILNKIGLLNFDTIIGGILGFIAILLMLYALFMVFLHVFIEKE